MYRARCLAVSPNFEIAKNNMAIALTDLGTKVVCCPVAFNNILRTILLYVFTIRRLKILRFFIMNNCYRFLLPIFECCPSDQVKLEGDINQGVAYYKKALYYNWHYADAMYNLGVAYGEMLKFDMVSDSYRREACSLPLYVSVHGTSGFYFHSSLQRNGIS